MTRDILVTGLPRSGLTIAAAFIDGLPGCVALNHPVWQLRKAADIDTASGYTGKLIADFALRRRQLLSGIPIPDLRAADGSALLDSLHDPRQPYDAGGERAFVAFTRPGLKQDFTLAMKQHALYTALLPQLVASKHFAVIAVIRHPLDTILSWMRQPRRAYAQGTLPEPLERFWPEAAIRSTDRLERLVLYYDAYCQRYHAFKSRINIVQYEELIEKPILMSTLLGIKSLPDAKRLEPRPRIYPADTADAIRAALKKHSTFAKQFYKW